MQLHGGVKSHPALSTGASGPRLNMCHRVRYRDDRISITKPHHHSHTQCFSGLQLSQVLWLITPATKQPGNGTGALFLKEKLFNKRIFFSEEEWVIPTPLALRTILKWIRILSKSHLFRLWQNIREAVRRPTFPMSSVSPFSCKHFTGCIFSDVVFTTNFFGIYQSPCHLDISVGSQYPLMNCFAFICLINSLPHFWK